MVFTGDLCGQKGKFDEGQGRTVKNVIDKEGGVKGQGAGSGVEK